MYTQRRDTNLSFNLLLVINFGEQHNIKKSLGNCWKSRVESNMSRVKVHSYYGFFCVSPKEEPLVIK